MRDGTRDPGQAGPIFVCGMPSFEGQVFVRRVGGWYDGGNGSGGEANEEGDGGRRQVRRQRGRGRGIVGQATCKASEKGGQQDDQHPRDRHRVGAGSAGTDDASRRETQERNGAGGGQGGDGDTRVGCGDGEPDGGDQWDDGGGGEVGGQSGADREVGGRSRRHQVGSARVGYDDEQDRGRLGAS